MILLWSFLGPLLCSCELGWGSDALGWSHTECYDSYSCRAGIVSVDKTVRCYGYGSCEKATLITTNNNVECGGSWSCYQSQSITAPKNISCNGLFSCAEVSEIKSYNEAVYCNAEQSCRGSTITVEASSTENPIACNAFQSCAASNISASYFEFSGAMSGQNSIFHAENGSTLIFSASGASYGSTIYCYGTCTISCAGGTSCHNLTLLCGLADNSCTWIKNCENSLQNDMCPDNLSIPAPLEFVSLRESEFDFVVSNVANSRIVCNDSDSLFVCDDFQSEACFEANLIAFGFGFETSTFDLDPLCCIAQEACARAGRISISTGILAPLDVAFRADGSQAVSNMSGVFTVSDGHMYFTAFDANGGVGIESVQGSKSYNVIVSGYYGITNSQVRIVRNLFCLAASACANLSLVSDVTGSVYSYGDMSLRGSRLDGVLGSLYCDGSESCSYVQVMDVGGDVVGAGFRVLFGVTAENVERYAFAHGYQAMREASITNANYVVANGVESFYGAYASGVTRLEVSGDDAMSGAKIVSDSQTGNTSIFIDGTNKQLYDIECSVGDICRIVCLSGYACTLMNLTCYGTCTIVCDANECFDSFETDVPSSEPTVGPTSGSTAGPTAVPSDQSESSSYNKRGFYVDSEIVTIVAIVCITCLSAVCATALCAMLRVKRKYSTSNSDMVNRGENSSASQKNIRKMDVDSGSGAIATGNEKVTNIELRQVTSASVSQMSHISDMIQTSQTSVNNMGGSTSNIAIGPIGPQSPVSDQKMEFEPDGDDKLDNGQDDVEELYEQSVPDEPVSTDTAGTSRGVVNGEEDENSRSVDEADGDFFATHVGSQEHHMPEGM